jgi:ammonium transporter, Amt family
MPEINTGDTAWVLAASALVLFMTPGLALFYGGLVRQKNVLSTIMHCFFAMGLISILWLAVGYALGFGPDHWGGFIGGGKYYGLDKVAFDHPGPFVGDVSLSGATPHAAYMIFQLMFAIITPALIAGAFAERIKFKGFVAFFALWSLLVYSPVAHWVWGGGWLFKRGVLDFAGGTVVHINAGVAALACAIFLGRRRGWPSEQAPPHNVPMMVLGAGILWFGWFGFNGGSALGAGALGTSAFVATHFGAAAAVFGWIIPEWLKHGKATTVGAATGAVAGLVAITPASGYVRPWAAIVIGFVAGFVCYYAVSLKYRFRYDDSLDVVGVHAVGGVIGAILTGFFADLGINAAGDNGAIFGNWAQVLDQFKGVGATIGYSLVVSLILLWIIDKTIGIRVTEEEELSGLDLSQHGESAYSTADVSGGVSSAAIPAPVSGAQTGPPGGTNGLG